MAQVQQQQRKKSQKIFFQVLFSPVISIYLYTKETLVHFSATSLQSIVGKYTGKYTKCHAAKDETTTVFFVIIIICCVFDWRWSLKTMCISIYNLIKKDNTIIISWSAHNIHRVPLIIIESQEICCRVFVYTILVITKQ